MRADSLYLTLIDDLFSCSKWCSWNAGMRIWITREDNADLRLSSEDRYETGLSLKAVEYEKSWQKKVRCLKR